MNQDREDIDWAKLKLIVSKFKKDFGISEEGRLAWTDEIAQNFVTELKLKLKFDNNPTSNLMDQEGDSSNEKQNEKVEEVSDTKVSQTEKRKMPGWMFSSTNDMAVKKKKKF